MANKIVTLPSGAKLEIQLADFEPAHSLLKAFAREAEQVKISLGLAQATPSDILKLNNLDENTINMLKNAVARMIASEPLEEALWPCMKSVLYNKVKVCRETFSKPEARQDFLPVMREVLMANLLPFGAGLGSILKAVRPESPTVGQK